MTRMFVGKPGKKIGLDSVFISWQVFSEICFFFFFYPCKNTPIQDHNTHFIGSNNQFQDVPGIFGQDSDRGTRDEICIVLWGNEKKQQQRNNQTNKNRSLRFGQTRLLFLRKCTRMWGGLVSTG